MRVALSAFVLLCYIGGRLEGAVAQPGGGPPGGGGGPGGDAGGGVQCAADGSDYLYTETISDDGLTRTIVTNNCPNHPYKNINPNYPVMREDTYNVPAVPMYDPNNAADLAAQGGVTGYYFSGVMVFSPYGGPNYGTVTGYDNSATAAEGDSFDMCSCHAASTSQPSYHCHVPPSCLLGQLGQESSSHSPQIGWAADGFPIYGPRGPGGVMMKRCAVTGGTEGVDDCTDAGGGLHRELPDVDDYVYRYYTLGIYNDGEQCANPVADLPGEEYYPNTPVSYSGCCPAGAQCTASYLNDCSNDAVAGTTSAYAATPAYAGGLDLNLDACWDEGEVPGSEETTTAASHASASIALASLAAAIVVNLVE